MKTKINVLLALFCVLMISGSAYAQFPTELTNWQIGARLGTYVYMGDVSPGAGFAAEGYLERKFADKVSLQGTMLFGWVNGGGSNKYKIKDIKPVWAVDPGAKMGSLAFKSSIFELLLHGKYYFAKETISPFVSLGGGMLFYTTTIDANGDDSYESAKGWNQVSTSDTEGSSLYNDGIPIGTWEVTPGAGFNYSFNDMFDLNMSFTFKFTGTSHIDGVDVSSGNNGRGGAAYYTQSGALLMQGKYTAEEFAAMSKKRSDTSTGSDKFILFNVGVNYKFFNPPAAGDEKKE
ncbi:MAG: hypothetical protein A3G23_00735 [Bacteroidetes bacterium RIFCSPLOWO2_12_FULL_37_12]|nr:MAG: hypothetical protein A3G23_00735 [Bacteroidetes bacterium RIFCSPLOWO2_12_FULL_37_12]